MLWQKRRSSIPLGITDTGPLHYSAVHSWHQRQAERRAQYHWCQVGQTSYAVRTARVWLGTYTSMRLLLGATHFSLLQCIDQNSRLRSSFTFLCHGSTVLHGAKRGFLISMQKMVLTVTLSIIDPCRGASLGLLAPGERSKRPRTCPWLRINGTQWERGANLFKPHKCTCSSTSKRLFLWLHVFQLADRQDEAQPCQRAGHSIIIASHRPNAPGNEEAGKLALPLPSAAKTMLTITLSITDPRRGTKPWVACSFAGARRPQTCPVLRITGTEWDRRAKPFKQREFGR